MSPTEGKQPQPWHEPVEALRKETRDMSRAISSLIEELEAVDWYAQRIDATEDAELARVLAHNRDEEKEHAAMVLEWIRRRDETFDAQLRRFLFTTEPLAEERASEPNGAGGLQIGSLKDEGATR